MILFYMLDGQPPWPDLDGVAAVGAAAREGSRPEPKAHWSPHLVKLLRAAWNDVPAKRPTFSDILDQLHDIHQRELKCTFEEALRRGAGGMAPPESGGCCSVM